MSIRIVFNGREYTSVEAMPEDVRKAYLDAMAMMGDAVADSLPDLIQGRVDEAVIRIEQSTVTFDGRTLATTRRLPGWLRGLVGAAAAQAAASARRHPDLPETKPPEAPAVAQTTMGIMLAFAAGFVLIFSVGLMFAVGGGRQHLAGRMTVAFAALLLLGWLDTMATGVAKRRQPVLAPFTPAYRRFVVLSASGLLLAMVLLLGLAWYLP